MGLTEKILMKSIIEETVAAPVESQKQRVNRTQKLAHRQELTSLSSEGGKSLPVRVADTPENRGKIQTALKALASIQPGIHSRYQIKVHNETGKLQIQVINHSTGKVVQEIPSIRLLEFHGMLEDFSGLLLEKRA